MVALILFAGLAALVAVAVISANERRRRGGLLPERPAEDPLGYAEFPTWGEVFSDGSGGPVAGDRDGDGDVDAADAGSSDDSDDSSSDSDDSSDD